MFVLTFGLAYLVCAMGGRADPLLITLAAVGKTSFFVLMVCFWAVGSLPVRAPFLAAADLVFAMLFLTWLVSPPVREAWRQGARPGWSFNPR
jgi:hypothetical protein